MRRHIGLAELAKITGIATVSAVSFAGGVSGSRGAFSPDGRPAVAESATEPSPSTRPSPQSADSPEPPAAQNTKVYAAPSKVFKKALTPLPEIKLLPPPHLMGPEEIPPLPLLVTLDDLTGVSVLGADSRIRIARAGDGLELGDSFQTGEKGSARVAFEKGVQVLMPPGSIIHLNEESVAGPGGGLDVPMVEVEQGEVRILVESGAKSDAGEEGVLRPLKLLVRTQAMVLGVRGTDFMVSVSGDHTDLHMVSGTVEYAVDAHALGLAHVMRANASELVEMVAHRPLPRAEHYEAGMLLKEYHERYPRLEQLWNSAVRDGKTRRLQAQFLELRTRKADIVNLQNGFPSSSVRREAQRLDDEALKWKLRRQGIQDEKGLNTRSKHRRRRPKKKVDPAVDSAEPTGEPRSR